MTLIYMITVLGAVALATGAIECNLTRPIETQQCFGEVGKPLIFHLPTNAATKIHLQKNNAIILRYSGNESIHTDPKNKTDRTFFQNGTFLFDKMIKNHSGDYQLQIYSLASGALLQKINFHLKILAPVSEPIVSQTCLTAEQMTVSCSAEGDEAEFTLSLDSNELIRTRSGKAEDPNVTISLHGQLVGNLVCNVQNNVSKQQTVFHLTSCKGATCDQCPLTLAGAVFATAGFLLLCVALFHVFKHLNRKSSPTTIREVYAEDDIVYSDVRATRATRQLYG